MMGQKAAGLTARLRRYKRERRNAGSE